MSVSGFSQENLEFVLYEVAGIEHILSYPCFMAHSRETFGLTLDTAYRIAGQYLKPAYAATDRHEPELKAGKVSVHPTLHSYYNAFAQSGLLAATFPEGWGGQALPKTIEAALQFILSAANNSFIMFTDLVKGVANMILQFGTQVQQDLYLPKLLSGEWAATMCLTESQAGSSLADITTSATPAGNGTFQIHGQKIFISAGDHDITPNIVHLVLARITGAPAGTKGISLFIVPKKRVNEAGELEDNGVESIGMNHKMGQKATPAMHLAFGGNHPCMGYLLGEANKGLPYMFQMMNAFRLEVGLMGVAVAASAYETSLQYAKVRTQGRHASAKDPQTAPVAIIRHPDVRRMLLSQKAFVEGTLAFILQCYFYQDLQTVSKEPTGKNDYQQLLELLTPVAKAYGSEGGNLSIYQALQVLGGYGYTTDFPIEQMARDARIFTIYEGTSGMQAIALLGRQIPHNNGESIDLWLAQVRLDIKAAGEWNELKYYGDQLGQEVEHWKAVTSYLLQVRESAGEEVFLANATLYMQLFGILNIAWQWLKMATIATRSLQNPQIPADRKVFYRSKICTMQFFFRYELSKCITIGKQLMPGDPLTLYNTEEEILI